MPLFGTSPKHRIWLCTDECGLTCATITWTLHVFAWGTITKLVLRPWLGLTTLSGLAHFGMYTLLTALSLASHLRAMLTNPGAVPPNAEPPPLEQARDGQHEEQQGRKKRWCVRCKAFKPSRAHHDSVTGRCVVKMDHFCPWVNNAVGLLNHKFFLLFCLYTCLQCVYSVSLVAWCTIDCSVQEVFTSDSGSRSGGGGGFSGGGGGGRHATRTTPRLRAGRHRHPDSRFLFGQPQTTADAGGEAAGAGAEAGVGAVQTSGGDREEGSFGQVRSAGIPAVAVAPRPLTTTRGTAVPTTSVFTTRDTGAALGHVPTSVAGAAAGAAGVGGDDVSRRLSVAAWVGNKAITLAGIDVAGGESVAEKGADAAASATPPSAAAAAAASASSLPLVETLVERRCGGLGLLTILVVLEGILFGLFTLCMLCDQSAMLKFNETKIDRLKGEKHHPSNPSGVVAVSEVFGSGSLVRRLLPLRVVFPPKIQDEVFGFILPSPPPPPPATPPPATPAQASVSASSSAATPATSCSSSTASLEANRVVDLESPDCGRDATRAAVLVDEGGGGRNGKAEHTAVPSPSDDYGGERGGEIETLTFETDPYSGNGGCVGDLSGKAVAGGGGTLLGMSSRKTRSNRSGELPS